MCALLSHPNIPSSDPVERNEALYYRWCSMGPCPCSTSFAMKVDTCLLTIPSMPFVAQAARSAFHRLQYTRGFEVRPRGFTTAIVGSGEREKEGESIVQDVGLVQYPWHGSPYQRQPLRMQLIELLCIIHSWKGRQSSEEVDLGLSSEKTPQRSGTCRGQSVEVSFMFSRLDHFSKCFPLKLTTIDLQE